jgi:hypothetical protein
MQGIDAIVYEKKGKGKGPVTIGGIKMYCPTCLPTRRVDRHAFCGSAGYPNVFVVTFSRAGEDNKSFK